MSPPTRVLVVANRTADSDELRAELRDRARRDPIEVTLLAPAAWEVSDPHGGAESARRRLRSARAALDSDAIPVRCVVGDANPEVAVEETWDADRFDEVIVCTLPAHLSRWLHQDLPRRVARITGRPVRHVIARERVPAA